MKLGYLAIGERFGTTHTLTGNGSPRKQLLEKCCRKHCAKMYADHTSGEAFHVGYIVGGEWYRIYEVHSWNGGNLT